MPTREARARSRRSPMGGSQGATDRRWDFCVRRRSRQHCMTCLPIRGQDLGVGGRRPSLPYSRQTPLDRSHRPPSAVPWPYVRPTATACKESSPLALPAACGPGEIDPRRQCGADHGHRRHAPWECPELGNGRKETLRNRSIRKPRRRMSSFGFDSILNGSRAGWRGHGQIRLVEKFAIMKAYRCSFDELEDEKRDLSL